MNLLLYPFEFYSNRRPLLFFSISLNSSSNNRLITLIIFQRIKVNLNTKLAVGQNNDTYHMGVDLFMERGYRPFTIGGGEGKEEKGKIKAHPVKRWTHITSVPFPFSIALSKYKYFLSGLDVTMIHHSLPPSPVPPFPSIFSDFSDRGIVSVKEQLGGRILGCPCSPPPTHPLFFSK